MTEGTRQRPGGPFCRGWRRAAEHSGEAALCSWFPQTGQGNRMKRCRYLHCNCDSVQLYKQTNSSCCYRCSAGHPAGSAATPLAPRSPAGVPCRAAHTSVSHCAACAPVKTLLPLLSAGHRPRLPRKHAASRACVLLPGPPWPATHLLSSASAVAARVLQSRDRTVMQSLQ